MNERLEKELELLRRHYADLEYKDLDQILWIKIPSYPVPASIWNREKTTICFEVNIPAYPGNAPYGFYVESGIRLKNEALPQNYSDSATTPFPGSWAKFSWSAENWQATSDLSSGSNLANFVATFADRFREAL
jgi:hypothetical protein